MRPGSRLNITWEERQPHQNQSERCCPDSDQWDGGRGSRGNSWYHTVSCSASASAAAATPPPTAAAGPGVQNASACSSAEPTSSMCCPKPQSFSWCHRRSHISNRSPRSNSQNSTWACAIRHRSRFKELRLAFRIFRPKTGVTHARL